LWGVRRHTLGLRESEEPVLLLVSGESGDRSGCLLLVGASLTEEGVKDELEQVSETLPSCESPSNDANRLACSESVDTTICWAESKLDVRVLCLPDAWGTLCTRAKVGTQAKGRDSSMEGVSGMAAVGSGRPDGWVMSGLYEHEAGRVCTQHSARAAGGASSMWA